MLKNKPRRKTVANGKLYPSLMPAIQDNIEYLGADDEIREMVEDDWFTIRNLLDEHDPVVYKGVTFSLVICD